MGQVNQLGKKTLINTIWKFAERILAQSVSLVVSIVLARLLTPDDYSVVGIVTIFFAFANVIISGGFNTALVQKKDADIEDYSSVLWINLLMATIVYVAIFFLAPIISKLYNQAILIPVFRIMGITLFINAFKSVLCAYISSHLQFRKFFWSTLIGTLVSAVVGIVMAKNGFGAWALVAQQMTNAVIDTIILFVSTKVRFVLKISKNKSKGLFKFGWKIQAASLLSVLYDEINPLIIGIRFSGADLSYYTKGKSFPSLLNSTIGNTLSAVLFPVMSKVQDEEEILLNLTRRFFKISSYVIFPLMIGFLTVSNSFVLVLLTDKWASASIYIQAFCIVYMFNIIQSGNLQVIRAVGRSDLILILEIVKKCSYAVVILLFVLFTSEPVYLALACIINTFIATVVNTFPNRKLIGYKYRLQIKDILGNLILASIMGVIVYCIGLLSLNIYFLLVLQISSGIIVYILLSIITRNENFKYLINLLSKILNKRKEGN